MEVIGIKSQISILSRATARVFRASKRSEVDQRSKEDDESLITPSELAILNCLMDGGFILSLKVFCDYQPFWTTETIARLDQLPF